MCQSVAQSDRLTAPQRKTRLSAIEAAEKKVDSVLDVFNPEDVQLCKDILELIAALRSMLMEKAR